jgi:hypothetical protein
MALMDCMRCMLESELHYSRLPQHVQSKIVDIWTTGMLLSSQA